MAEKEILVFGEKEFRIKIPDNAKITFGPWSPPAKGADRYAQSDTALRGTLRIYLGTKSTENIIAVFSGVRGFRDLSLEYMEKVAVQEGNSMWKSDRHGYVQERKESSKVEWVPGDTLLEGGDESDSDGVPF